MALSDTAIRAAKHGAKPIKLFDTNGLFLLLQPSGGKLWRLKYRHLGKEKKLSIGRYPEVGLKEARRRRDQAREVLANGFDPAEQRRLDKEVEAQSAANTFGVIGDEYLTKAAPRGCFAGAGGLENGGCRCVVPEPYSSVPVSRLTGSQPTLDAAAVFDPFLPLARCAFEALADIAA